MWRSNHNADDGNTQTETVTLINNIINKNVGKQNLKPARRWWTLIISRFYSFVLNGCMFIYNRFTGVIVDGQGFIWVTMITYISK